MSSSEFTPSLSAPSAAPVSGASAGLSRTGGAVLVLAVAAFLLFLGAPNLLSDPDTLWHVRVGLDIASSGAFPRTDPYSHTFAGEPWIAKEWLSQIVLATAYQAGGWNGVAAASAFALLSALALVYRHLAEHLRPIAAALLAVWCFSLSSGVFLARPHIIALPFIILFVGGVWRRAEAGAPAPFWLLSALCLWANLHGSFTFGFLAAGLAFIRYTEATKALRMHVPNKDMRGWLLFLMACPLATLIHPYGPEAIWSTVVIAKSEALAYIREWRPFSAQTDQFIALNLVAALVATLASGFRVRLATALFIGLLVFLYLKHVRFMHFLFLLAPMLVARDLATAFPKLWARVCDDAAGGVSIAPRGRAVRIGMVLAGAAAVLAPVRALTPPATALPTKALAAAQAAGLKGPVYNGYSFGGALVFAGVPTFVDGRTDRLYNGGFVHGIERSKEAAGGGQVAEHIETYGLTWTLLRRGDPRIVWFDGASDWGRLYEDETAVVHVRTTPAAKADAP